MRLGFQLRSTSSIFASTCSGVKRCMSLAALLAVVTSSPGAVLLAM